MGRQGEKAEWGIRQSGGLENNWMKQAGFKGENGPEAQLNKERGRIRTNMRKVSNWS